ncbi:hypothetical protein FB45DRAFT_1116363 [Roridomyces roridus]|uniref:Uncharacterized protein n=1 Tax=Roridomyces roridus TaxID=1738132 RepID=A0AAD7FV36_9AGAR|nr:hypothetical protein FB45DRAFT_1116363 [Roridomyces roridus]
MKLIASVLLAFLGAVSAQFHLDGVRRGDEQPFVHIPLAEPEDYACGKVHMMLMDMMTAAVDDIRADVVRATGIFDPMLGLKPIEEFTPCVDGFAGTDPNATFMCNDLDLYTFMPHRALGSTAQVGSDIWGWAHTEDGVTREFGLVCQ